MPYGPVEERNPPLLVPNESYPGQDGMIQMGYILVVDNQSVWAGKGNVERNPPQNLQTKNTNQNFDLWNKEKHRIKSIKLIKKIIETELVIFFVFGNDENSTQRKKKILLFGTLKCPTWTSLNVFPHTLIFPPKVRTVTLKQKWTITPRKKMGCALDGFFSSLPCPDIVWIFASSKRGIFFQNHAQSTLNELGMPRWAKMCINGLKRA